MRFAPPFANGHPSAEATNADQTLAAVPPSVHAVPKSWLNEEDFKRKIVSDILSHLDYQSAEQNGVVDVRKEEIAQELERLSARTLIAWHEAFLFVRSELIYGGYELNGLRIIGNPADVLRKLMKSDPEFDIQQYIF